MSYMLGALTGALLITLLLTRVVGALARKKTEARTAAFVAFGVVLALTLGIGSMTMGLRAASVTYLPFLMLWLVVDLLRAWKS